MYQLLVKRHLRKQFDHLSVGDYESVLRGVDDHIHRLAGDRPLGGKRHTEQELRLWVQRLFRLYNNLAFDVHRITLTGWPWDLRAAADVSRSSTHTRTAKPSRRRAAPTARR